MNPDLPYPSRRQPVLADNVVATSQPLATSAGLRMLAAGGNAIDAAVSAAIALTVVEPTSNGIGGDLFAIVWDGHNLHGINSSGRSPAAWTRDRFEGMESMPSRGWMSVTVPGAPAGWVELSRRFGRLPLARLFEPAIAYAREGFPVSPITARAWQRSVERLGDFPDFLRTFAPEGRAPRAGERFASEAHAQTLREIATSGGESFYNGPLARKIAQHSENSGGLLTVDDLQEHRCEDSGTLSISYRGFRLHEIPPNGQGIAALIALGILAHFPLERLDVDCPDCVHLQIEAMKLAFADTRRFVADPKWMDIDPLDLLEPGYLAGRAALIDPKRAGDPPAGHPDRGGTVCLSAADAEGRMISLIQSNYLGFGSGIVIPGTGIAMQNRGHGFVLTRGHPNEVGPRKRPFHTIIPGFVTHQGKPWMSFGLMGGHMQPQGHVQMVVRCVDFGQNPQAASDAPRWQVVQGRKVLLEHGWPPGVVEELQARGHEVVLADATEFGGAQLIQRLPAGGYVAASDHRKDGHAAGF
ncbi:MAG: gamma-glutamyltransferase family protein [Phycisphaerae bacterium]|nr:gamma-glutamyltransferase family protein [Phycisphaerae bacterium]MDW8262434.1 gamma-glutamyltransferase family protein [Phycisphaerales bacterium]